MQAVRRAQGGNRMDGCWTRRYSTVSYKSTVHVAQHLSSFGAPSAHVPSMTPRHRLYPFRTVAYALLRGKEDRDAVTEHQGCALSCLSR